MKAIAAERAAERRPSKPASTCSVTTAVAGVHGERVAAGGITGRPATTQWSTDGRRIRGRETIEWRCGGSVCPECRRSCSFCRGSRQRKGAAAGARTMRAKGRGNKKTAEAALEVGGGERQGGNKKGGSSGGAPARSTSDTADIADVSFAFHPFRGDAAGVIEEERRIGKIADDATARPSVPPPPPPPS